MKRVEIERKFDEIVEFSGIGQFIDTPVKRYSSGMYLRLAFAVAAHMEPEILVVDEVLAVGDAEFQRKCLGKMSDVASQGRTVLFVSHNMSAILRLTQETILLEKGNLVLRAPSPQAVDYYLTSGFAHSGEHHWLPDEIPADAAPFCPIALRVRNTQGQVVDTVRSTEPVFLEIEYALEAPSLGCAWGFTCSPLRASTSSRHSTRMTRTNTSATPSARRVITPVAAPYRQISSTKAATWWASMPAPSGYAATSRTSKPWRSTWTAPARRGRTGWRIVLG